MISMAKLAARYFDFAEITEMHQERKVDAPSGTAYTTAQEMVAARGKPFEHTMPEKDTLPGARGAVYQGVAIHSQRLPGFVAHQEVTLAAWARPCTSATIPPAAAPSCPASSWPRER
jgi:4-hydroxy-tetrahydrodipicolinate reductase